LHTPQEGIAVEFLQYLAPTDGKPFPADTRSNDIWHWQTSFESAKPEDLASNLMMNKFSFISTGLIDVIQNNLGFRKAFLARDPDGHAIRVVGN
jgi:hypothetical protein